MIKDIKVGTILENSIREFTKVLSVKNGMYGLSGWNSSRKDVEKSTVVTIVLNSFGIEATEAKIVGKGKVEESEVAPNDSDAKPTKTSLSKLSAEEVKALAVELKLDAEGTKPEILEKLFAHYGL